MMYNFILGSDLESGAYSVTINERGQLIDVNSGDAIGQLAPWPPEKEGSGAVEQLFQEEEIPPPLPESIEDLEEMVEQGELFIEEVPSEESETEPSAPTDVSGGGSGIGEDEASGHGESTPEDESDIAFGSEG